MSELCELIVEIDRRVDALLIERGQLLATIDALTAERDAALDAAALEKSIADACRIDRDRAVINRDLAQCDWQRLLHENAALAARLGEAEGLLRRVEWAGDFCDEPACPICLGRRAHTQDCDLHRALTQGGSDE